MAKVLVTGGNGFIGSHLVRALLAHGDEVTCLVRRTSNLDRLRSLELTIVYGDVTDPESLTRHVAGNSIVYHLAGCVSALRKRQFFQVNQEGVRNMADGCARQTNPPVLVVVSSLAAAGPAPRGRLRTESDPLRQVSNYGRSKRGGEQAAEQHAHQVPITIVRPPIVFGESDKYGFALFRSVERYGVHLVSGYRPKKFSIIHADDLTQLLILAAERGTRLPAAEPQAETPSTEGYYFAASEEHPTYYQLGRMIGKALGRGRTLIIPFGAAVVWSVAGIGELIGQIRRWPVLFGIDKAREATAGSWACSAQAAVDQLGFSPLAPLPDRLRQTAQWYRQQGWL